jgi:hypothetical protein
MLFKSGMPNGFGAQERVRRVTVEFEVTFTVTVNTPTNTDEDQSNIRAKKTIGRNRESSGVEVGGGQGWKTL